MVMVDFPEPDKRAPVAGLRHRGPRVPCPVTPLEKAGKSLGLLLLLKGPEAKESPDIFDLFYQF
jgi:hypothetical protein